MNRFRRSAAMLWTATFLVLNLHWGNLWWTALFGVLFGMDVSLWIVGYSLRHRPAYWVEMIEKNIPAEGLK